MLRVAARAAALAVRTLLAGSRSARMWLLGSAVVVLAFGGSVLGPATLQVLGLMLVLLTMVIVFRLLLGGGPR